MTSSVFLHNSTRLMQKIEFTNSLLFHLKRTRSNHADDSFSKQCLKCLGFWRIQAAHTLPSGMERNPRQAIWWFWGDLSRNEILKKTKCQNRNAALFGTRIFQTILTAFWDVLIWQLISDLAAVDCTNGYTC